jgi:hypothetical protein
MEAQADKRKSLSSGYTLFRRRIIALSFIFLLRVVGNPVRKWLFALIAGGSIVDIKSSSFEGLSKP